MYQNLNKRFSWEEMKRDIAYFIERCFTCRQVKMEYQRLVGNLHPLPISEWKRNDITMDFILGLPRTPSGKNSIWVIVDGLTQSAHFFPSY